MEGSREGNDLNVSPSARQVKRPIIIPLRAVAWLSLPSARARQIFSFSIQRNFLFPRQFINQEATHRRKIF